MGWPVRLYCDNKSAISIVLNLVQHDQTKLIQADKHFIKEKLDSGLTCMPYVSTGCQLADVLTKELSSVAIQTIVSKLGMENLFTNLRSVGKGQRADLAIFRKDLIVIVILEPKELVREILVMGM